MCDQPKVIQGVSFPRGCALDWTIIHFPVPFHSLSQWPGSMTTTRAGKSNQVQQGECSGVIADPWNSKAMRLWSQIGAKTSPEDVFEKPTVVSYPSHLTSRPWTFCLFGSCSCQRVITTGDAHHRVVRCTHLCSPSWPYLSFFGTSLWSVYWACSELSPHDLCVSIYLSIYLSKSQTRLSNRTTTTIYLSIVHIVSGEKHSPADGSKEHNKERVVFMANGDTQTVIISGASNILILPIWLVDLCPHLNSMKILYKSFEL